MTKKDFPLKDLKSNLEDVQSSLNEAEKTFSRDKGLIEAVRKARDVTEKVSKKLKSNS